jgi:hypothetical protein
MALLHRDETLQLSGLLMALQTVDEIDLDLRVGKSRFGATAINCSRLRKLSMITSRPYITCAIAQGLGSWRFERALTKLVNGTEGTFCSPIDMSAFDP